STVQFMAGGPNESNRWPWSVNFATGGAIVAAMSTLRLLFAAWPLRPIGFLLGNTYPFSRMWFSIFLGWLLKALVVKFGGGTLFQKARPFAIGIIVGEAFSSGFWLMVALARLAMDLPYRQIYFTP